MVSRTPERAQSRPPEVRITTDPAHGGRWTSLRAGTREWLWRREEPRRAGARPGDDFADAGGLEECVPTVRGIPDHGDAWSRRWTARGDTASVRCPDFHLTRRITTEPGRAVADYRLTADPGYRFLWAAHALLDVSPRGRIAIAEGAPGRCYPDGGARWTPFAWPRAGEEPAGGRPLGGGPTGGGPVGGGSAGGGPTSGGPVGGGAATVTRFDLLGPDDGTALGAIMATSTATVHDGPDMLAFTLEAPGQPVSVALWRNLRGFPEPAPYRSIGVEPMLGRAFDLGAATDEDCARVPAGGEVRWRLTVTASP
ncbi:hypothetical protein [Streptomyces sp. NBC_01190]|uniref:hypothetical protein n=1 Tax=Streptomyces sp. NBC_01190 TaxID=2903767 RepID=UPI00386B84E5|nr:hypothetical protein OG519_03695 [Streptomyces sp. NBC_01190]